MSPDESALSDAPLRFGERTALADHDGERDEPTPAGPPPLREASHEPIVDRHEVDVDEGDEGDEPVERDTEQVESIAPVRSTPKPGASDAPTANPSRRQRKKAAKRRARKVKRIVRRFDAWSVLKVAFIFNLCLYVVCMVAVVVLWRVADSAGVIENVESFIEDLGAFETFQFEPDQLFEATALGGAVLAVLATGLMALGAVLFNLISDLVGGIRLTVIEEPGWKPAKRRGSVGTDAKASGTVSEPSGDEPVGPSRASRGYSSVG